MKKILNLLRKRPKTYDRLKKIYGKTFGFWKLKEFYLEHIGIYNGKKRVKLLDKIKSNKLIIEKIKSNKPLMLTRFGSTEFRNLVYNGELSNLCFYSGFFPDDPGLLRRFKKVYAQSIKLVDVLIVWNYKNHFIKKLKLIKNFQNINYIVPSKSVGGIPPVWINALKNKRVLVIHPFKKSIEHQYKKRAKLKILPKLKSLQIIRAVQTLASNEDKRFKTWFDALEFMKKEITKKKFDIAIIGCGAYGLPLAAHVKSLGKQALHLGGGSQLLFGIKGKRWEAEKEFSGHWISPLKEDIPKDHEKIEGSCYW